MRESITKTVHSNVLTSGSGGVIEEEEVVVVVVVVVVVEVLRNGPE